MDMLQGFNTSMRDLIEDYINNSFIIGFGFITEVIDIDIVSVQVGAATKEKDITISTCILGSMCSNNMTVKVDPQKGDRVIVFYPRTYEDRMFDPDTEGTVIESDANGYAYGKGIAFLANQFFTDSYKKNLSHITDETIDMNVTDKDITININNGETTAATLAVTSKGAVSYSVGENKVIDISDKGAITINTANNDLSIDAGTGNVSIKGTKVTVNDTSLEVQ